MGGYVPTELRTLAILTWHGSTVGRIPLDWIRNG